MPRRAAVDAVADYGANSGSDGVADADGVADGVLDRLHDMPRPPVRPQVALSVRAALLRRQKAAAAAAAAAEEEEEERPSFSVTGERHLTCAEVSGHVFGRRNTMADVVRNAEAGLNQVMSLRVLAATLFRYREHRASAMESALLELRSKPEEEQIMSLRIKWDETEQNMMMASPLANESMNESMPTLRSSARRVHVMTTGIWVQIGRAHTHEVSPPQPWAMNPLILENTKAECLWRGLSLSAPFGPWREFPNAEQVRWFWLILCGDGATSNMRLYTKCIAESRSMRSRVLLHFSPCLLHILHRCSIPLMKQFNMVNDFFRCGNVMSQGSYWAALLRRVRLVLNECVVLHHDMQSRAASLVASELLAIALCGIEDAKLKQDVKSTRDEMLATFPGDWSSGVIMLRCREPRCLGGEACKARAVDKACHVVARTCLTRRLAIPTLSRWWRFQPFAQQILLGVSLHGLLARAAPSGAKHCAIGADVLGDVDPGLMDDRWHEIFGFRVRKTFEFLSAPATPGDIILVLKAMQLPSRIMAWLMDRESLVRLAKPGADGRISIDKARIAVTLDWVSPEKSPLWAALGDGLGMLMGRLDDKWRCYQAYYRGSRDKLLVGILGAVLPVQARIWWRGVHAVESWPLRLVRLLSATDCEKDMIAHEFSTAKPCCVPLAIRDLQKAVARPRDVLARHFRLIIEAFAAQLDFTNYDQELNHARMKQALRTAQGKSRGAALAVIHHHASSIMTAHHFLNGQVLAKKRVGRPPGEHTKRLKLDGWMVFVREHKPDGGQKQEHIKSGEHLRTLGRQWAALSQAERDEYNEKARRGRAYKSLHLADAAAATCDGVADADGGTDRCGAWGLGEGDMPLRPDLLCKPCFTKAFGQDVDDWVREAGTQVDFCKASMPQGKAPYDDPCPRGACRGLPTWPHAAEMLHRWLSCPGCGPLSAWQIVGDIPGDRARLVSSFFLLAHRQDQPKVAILVPLKLTGATQPCDAAAGAQLPWELSLATHARDGERERLDFKLGAQVFAELSVEFHKKGVDDVVARRLQFCVGSLLHLRVTGRGESHALRSSALDDMREVAESADAAASREETRDDDMAAILGDDAGAARTAKRKRSFGAADAGPRGGANAEAPNETEEDECDYEYEYEFVMAKEAKEALTAWRDDVDADEAEAHEAGGRAITPANLMTWLCCWASFLARRGRARVGSCL